MSNSLANIEAFLRQERLALVGASHDPKDFSRAVMRELLDAGYEVVPINPRGGTIEGRTAYARLTDLPEPVGGALVMTPAGASEGVVRDAAAAHIPRVWLHRGGGPGSTSPEAVRAAHDLGLSVVDGECPMMFVGRSRVHRFHGAMRRLNGGFPRADKAPRLPSPLVWGLGLLQLLVGLAALGSGLLLALEPSGANLGMSADLLAPGPFSSYLLPGLALAVLIGVGHVVGFGRTVGRRARAARTAILLGVALVLWIAAELLWVSATSWLQPAMAGVGAVEVALGVAMHQHRWPRPAFAIRVAPAGGGARPPVAAPPSI